MKCPEGYSIQARTEASEVVCTSAATHPTLQETGTTLDFLTGVLLFFGAHSPLRFRAMMFD